MAKTTLLIMAAGLGSRYGGIKQLEQIGPNGEIIMDYSIHDALCAGFNQIIIVLRKEIEKDFMEVIGNRITEIIKSANAEIAFAFQDPLDIPCNYPEGRTKPWGTGQAVLAAKNFLDTPFAVINADDYYGKMAFNSLHSWLVADHKDSDIVMAGFVLKNTLSEHGGVTRGICQVTDNNRIVRVIETTNIERQGSIIVSDKGTLDENSLVSMNMWGFPGNPPKFLSLLEKDFSLFFEEQVKDNPLKAEYLLPIIIGSHLRKGDIQVMALPTADKWFGVTYKEDKPMVVNAIRELINKGQYNENLYSDII